MIFDKYDAKNVGATVISSRIRLARNVCGVPFVIKNGDKALKFAVDVTKSLNRIENFTLYKMKDLSYTERASMVERYFISKYLFSNVSGGAVAISQDERVSVMINEEDQIRAQCILGGLQLKECYKRLSKLDDELSKYFDFAFDDDFGYLTACPSNVGTGLRASAMMFLPALTESGQIQGVMEKAKELGLTFRGIYGEGSKADSYIYQISNEVTLGKSEEYIIEEVEKFVMSVSYSEVEIRGEIYQNKPIELKDRCMRAYGVLTNCAYLEYEEFLSLITLVKLGITLNLFKFKDDREIDNLIVSARPNIIKLMNGDDISVTEEGIARAKYVAKSLKELTER